MNRLKTRLFAAFLATLFASLILGSASSIIPHATAATEWCGSWQQVSSPSPGPVYNSLWGVAARSKTDIWAVGGSGVPTLNHYPLNSGIVEHWNGAHWNVIPSPEPGNYQNFLEGVATLSSDDVWAVGLAQNAKGGYEEKEKTLVEHWDGTRWSLVKSPSPGTFNNSLSAVTALAPNDIWAVGAQGSLQGPGQTLIEHWNGTYWSVVSSPNPGTYDNGLSAVTALSSSDVWAVGNYANGKSGARTLVERWNGKQWRVVQSPSVGQFDNELWSVSAVAANDIWTVGLNWAAPGNIIDTLIEHWNGHQWSVVPSLSPTGNDDLHGVVALASNNVWAVGGSAFGPLIEHWDGHQWKLVASQGTGSWFLNRIAALTPHDLWAVGSTTTQMLIMHYC